MAKKTGRPAKLVNPWIQSFIVERSKLDYLRRLAHERSIETQSNVSVCDLVREAIDAHFGQSMLHASEAKSNDPVVTM